MELSEDLLDYAAAQLLERLLVELREDLLANYAQRDDGHLRAKGRAAGVRRIDCGVRRDNSLEGDEG